MRIESITLQKKSSEMIGERVGSLDEHKVNPHYMDGVIPTIAAVTVGFLFPKFRLGALVGLAQLLPQAPIIAAVMPGLSEEPFYKEILSGNALIGCVFVPVFEEVIFRIFLESGIQRISEMAFSSSIVMLPFGIPLSSATLATILISSAIFGFVHVFNEHKLTHLQAVHAFVGGVAYSFLNRGVGLEAACAGHIMNNSAILLPLRFWKSCVSEQEEALEGKQAPSQTGAEFRERLL